MDTFFLLPYILDMQIVQKILKTRIGMTYIEKTKIILGKIASGYCEQLQIKSKK